jgi:hypothetical protein
MPNDSNLDSLRICEGALRNFTLLTLPWLCLQRQTLEIAIDCMKNASNLKPIQKFTLSELQALAMISDPSGTMRNLIDPDLEEKLEHVVKEIFPRFASASIQCLEAQEMIMDHLFDGLNELKKGTKASGDSNGKANAKSD